MEGLGNYQFQCDGVLVLGSQIYRALWVPRFGGVDSRFRGFRVLTFTA